MLREIEKTTGIITRIGIMKKRRKLINTWVITSTKGSSDHGYFNGM